MTFRELHDRLLLLPNAWDVASARIIEDAGAAAIATTSAGVAWSLGAADGNHLTRERAVDLVARIVAAVEVPVTADIESGYGDVTETVRGVVDAGAVGINIEDGLGSAEEHVERIKAARAVSDTLFINARIDTYLLGDKSFEDTVARAAAYVEAGADGVFVPGVADPAVIGAMVEAITVPLNVLVGPGSPTVAELARLGVTRISLGSGIAQAAYAVARLSAHELFTLGTYTSVADGVDYGELNTLLAHR